MWPEIRVASSSTEKTEKRPFESVDVSTKTSIDKEEKLPVPDVIRSSVHEPKEHHDYYDAYMKRLEKLHRFQPWEKRSYDVRQELLEEMHVNPISDSYLDVLRNELSAFTSHRFTNPISSSSILHERGGGLENTDDLLANDVAAAPGGMNDAPPAADDNQPAAFNVMENIPTIIRFVVLLTLIVNQDESSGRTLALLTLIALIAFVFTRIRQRLLVVNQVAVNNLNPIPAPSSGSSSSNSENAAHERNTSPQVTTFHNFTMRLSDAYSRLFTKLLNASETVFNFTSGLIISLFPSHQEQQAGNE